jgi:ankyrin repeat protein
MLSLLALALAWTGLSVSCPASAQTILAREPEIVQAIMDGDLPRVKSLVIQGENPAVTSFDGLNGIAIAARNGDYEMLDYLFQVGVPPNAPDELGNGAIHWVTFDGDYDMAAYLLDNGADVNMPNGRGLTPLMIAAREGYLDVLNLYIDRGADLGYSDYTGRSAVDWARDSRTPGVYEALIQAGG